MLSSPTRTTTWAFQDDESLVVGVLMQVRPIAGPVMHEEERHRVRANQADLDSVLVPGRVALAGAALPGTQAMAGDVTTVGHGVEGAGRGLPGAAVRARIPSVARSALWGITGKMAASFQSCPAADQS